MKMTEPRESAALFKARLQLLQAGTFSVLMPLGSMQRGHHLIEGVKDEEEA